MWFLVFEIWKLLGGLLVTALFILLLFIIIMGGINCNTTKLIKYLTRNVARLSKSSLGLCNRFVKTKTESESFHADEIFYHIGAK